ncbi:uncharacterized protein LOC123519597 [Portunus trituberculatus]|uniref:uncharacterized protein LOC123519597 n=1 Tax=Portunus trituberculatus TaxID=210409 RepID=UPI001E1CC780|nr:uncharacterized protein LOC123519597 [Portunus trituberculatus]
MPRGYPEQNQHKQIHGRRAGLLQMTQLHTPTGSNYATHHLGQPAALYDSVMFPGRTRQGASTYFSGTLTEQQGLTQPQDGKRENVPIRAFGRPANQKETTPPAGLDGHSHTFLRPMEPRNLTQDHQGPRVTYFPEQPDNHDLQDIIQRPATVPRVPSHGQGPTYPVLSGSCPQGQVVHADGSCVVPEVTRDLYVFSIPDMPRRPTRPPPTLPPPRVHEHVLFIRAPEGGHTAQPLLVPPPAQKSVVYILREDSPDEEPRVIQAPAPPPARPEVFFVNYEEGENPALHGGLDLQQVLQTVTSAPPALHDAAVLEHVQEAPQQQIHSKQELTPVVTLSWKTTAKKISL